MKILTLSIKQKFFDDIVAGTKKEEYREVTPISDHKYLQIDDEGFAVQTETEDFVPREYDAIQFYSGQMKGKRPGALVEIVGSRCEILFDEDGEPVIYEHEGEDHVACRMVYSLGKIVQKTE